MKLFYAVGSCALGIRILLEEIGAPYDLVALKLAEAQQRAPEYLAINPKGKVPALIRPDGRLLTEYPLISLWLAQNFPAAGLLPQNPDDLWGAMELVEYVVSSLHMRGATLAMRPDKFLQDPAAQADLAEAGRAVLREGFAQLESRLAGREFFFERFTIADAAVFYLLNWKARIGMDLPPALAAYHARLSERPAIARAMALPS